MAKAPKQKFVTKKHLARIERERRQTRIILAGTIAVFVLAIGLVGFGILNEKVLKPLKPVATVGEDKITIREFQENARYARLQIINNYLQIQQFFGDSESIQSYLAQIQAQLDPVTLGQSTLNSLIEDRLIRQEAARRGITVSPEEVEKKLQEFFGYYPDGTPTPEPTLESRPTSTLSPLQLTLIPPTATPTPYLTTTVDLTPTATLTATPTPTSTPVEPTPTSTLQPTPTPYTLEEYSKNYQEYIKQLTNIQVSEAMLRRLAESVLYREKVQKAVLADLKPEEEQVWARHILVEDEEAAKEVIDRLNKGESFAALASEMSVDAASAARGGDLGWFGKGRMVAEFEQAAFSLSIGEISKPVKSQYGYHIIQVLGHEMRPLQTSEFEQLRQKKFQEWLDAQREAAQVQIIEEKWLDFVPTEPALPTG